MIQYTLKCADGHEFNSWFQSADAFEKLSKTGMVACAVCGSGDVEKAIMAPRVRPARNAVARSEPENDTAPAPSGPLTTPSNPAEQAMAELKKQIEDNSDYVGMNFASEARAMHEGDTPERAIYGEARIDEARALLEDGVPVAPLPFRPQRKIN